MQRLNPYYRGTCDFDERLRDHNFPKVNYVRQIEFCGRRGAEPHRGRLGHLHGGAAPYRGTSLIRKRSPLGPYRRAIPRVLGGSWVGGWAFSYERDTPAPNLRARLLGSSVRGAQFRPLTPNTVELVARGGLVLPSVLKSTRPFTDWLCLDPHP